MKIMVINGPNINMLGIREPDVYGNENYEGLVELIRNYCESKGLAVDFVQSNHEGVLIDAIQRAYFDKYDGIVINPAAYTHTSVALLDALKAVKIPCVEVHISNVDKREDFRRHSYIANACIKTIKGLGFAGYLRAIDALMESIGD